MSEGTQRRLAAIVSADVVGYSKLMGVDETGTHARLQACYRDLVKPKIDAHNGRMVKLMGDGLLAEFPCVVDAVNWAVDVQTAAVEFNIDGLGDQRIEYRVGVNLGDIIVDGDDVFGGGVNIAARLQEIATPGGLCISAKVYDEVAGKLDVDFADGGARSMKNIALPIQVWNWLPGGGQTQASEIEPELALPDKPSIAVLPFENMSRDPEQDYFVDGVVEDILTTLSRVPDLFVIARNSSFTYKGKTVDVR